MNVNSCKGNEMTKKRKILLLILLLTAAAALVFRCAVSGRGPTEQMNAAGETAGQASATAEQLEANIRSALEDNRCGEILLSDEGSTASCPGVSVREKRVEITSPGIYRVSGSLDGGCVSILLSDEGSTASCPGITITEKKIEITAPGIYQVSGSLDGGQLMIRCTGNVGLVLNGITVLNPEGPALSVEDAVHVQLWLAEGTENRLVSGTPVEITGPVEDSGEETDGGAAVYARDTLSVAGPGMLIAEGYLHNAISSTDHVVILDGNLKLAAVNNGIRGKDSVTVSGGRITILCGNDGIHSVNGDQENAMTGSIRVTGGETEIRCYGDGLHAGKDLQVLDGTVTVNAGETDNLALNDEQNPQKLGTEGFGMPDGMQPPEGQQPPDGMQMPGGQQPPDGAEETADDSDKRDQRGRSGIARGFMEPRRDWGNGFGDPEGNPDKTNEGSGGKGLKSGGILTISGGTVTVTSADDSIHADD